jgi:hypothetical protein
VYDRALHDQTALVDPRAWSYVLHYLMTELGWNELGPVRDLAARRICHLFLLQLPATVICIRLTQADEA